MKILYKYGNVKPLYDNSLDINKIAKTRYFFVDRFGNLPTLEDIDTDRFPQFTNKTFEEICMERALSIKNLNKPIVVNSSTGVDSLTIISLLYMIGADFSVVCFPSTELDYKYINYFKKLGIKHYITTELSQHYDNVLIVDGNCGDQLSHSAAFFKHPNEHMFIHDFNAMKNTDAFQEWLSKSPIELLNDTEIKWYISYSCKWRNVQYYHTPVFIESNFGYIIDMNNYIPFFGTEEFSDWAASNYHTNLAKDFSNPKNYKTMFKDIIGNVIKDDSIYDIGKGFSMLSKTLTVKPKRYILYYTEPSEKIIFKTNGGLKIEQKLSS